MWAFTRSRKRSGGRLGSVKPILWIVTGSVLSALVVDGLTARQYSRDLWVGLLGPLAVVTVSWGLTARVHRTDPRKVTALMIGAFAGKLIFFGAYVALALVAFGVQPVPFALSLTGYFIVLHGIEALLLKRLFV